MLPYQISQFLKKNASLIFCQRNIGIVGPMLAKADDPIQQLFLEKLKEYRSKSGGGNKLLDPSPEIKKELQQEYDKITKHYGGAEGADMTKFPTFSFTEPKIDPINLEGSMPEK